MPKPSRSRPAPSSPPEDPGLRELRQIQETFARALFRPLTASDELQPKWDDGRPTLAVLEEFIKPNDRLNASERIEIYSRSYWYRILDCMYEDFPAVRSIIGDRRFDKLITAFLAEFPSESYTLRDLGSRFPDFMRAHPELSGPHHSLAYDAARFEWAQVVTWDNEALPTLGTDALLGADPAELRLGLQPYLMLLELDYELDNYLIAVRRAGETRSEASNAVSEQSVRAKLPRLKRPRAQKSYLGIHRMDNTLYFKRLTPVAFAILTALQHGETLAAACDAGVAAASPEEDLAKTIQESFHDWAALGWLCAPAKSGK